MREAFRQAAEYFYQLADQVPVDGWGSDALGVWTVRDLVGHTSRAMTTLERYCNQPGEQVEVEKPVSYFRRALESMANPEDVAERGRQSGQDFRPKRYARLPEGSWLDWSRCPTTWFWPCQ